MSQNQEPIPCGHSRAILPCKFCETINCKSCTDFVEPHEFQYGIGTDLYVEAGSYCKSCYQQKVIPVLEQYEETLKKAKNINIYDITQSKETRRISRKEPWIEVKDVLDRDEALIRMAFIAVIRNFNTLIDVDIKSVKVQNGTYQHSVWTGRSRPTDY